MNPHLTKHVLRGFGIMLIIPRGPTLVVPPTLSCTNVDLTFEDYIKHLIQKAIHVVSAKPMKASSLGARGGIG